jgi:hypothetical protein
MKFVLVTDQWARLEAIGSCSEQMVGDPQVKIPDVVLSEWPRDPFSEADVPLLIGDNIFRITRAWSPRQRQACQISRRTRLSGVPIKIGVLPIARRNQRLARRQSFWFGGFSVGELVFPCYVL